jgi:hypothetical protein
VQNQLLPAVVVPSRRAFFQRAVLAAAVAVPTGAALLGNAPAAHACTPNPLANIRASLVSSYRNYEGLSHKWMLGASTPTMQGLRLAAFAHFIDDYCGTVPKVPPIPPRPFELYANELGGLDELAQGHAEWLGLVEAAGIPAVVALDLLRSDLDAALQAAASAAAGAAQLAYQAQPNNDSAIWRPWWIC